MRWLEEKDNRMKLHNKIKQQYTTNTLDTLVVMIGYRSIKKGRKTLQSFLDSKSIYGWIKSGYFDMKYDSHSFVEELAHVLHVDISKELKEACHRLELVSSMKSPYIFVDTNFKRRTEPIHILGATVGHRIIVVKKEDLLFKNEYEVLEIIGNRVKKHFLHKKGYLAVWGQIKQYVYHHHNGKTYLFDSNGVVKKEGI